ncbi:MAG: hypothetical protein FJ368_07305 [Pelagibacterales bacterium]|nr:hypothetical protein [Pelagibacterales bacterium]
MENKNAQLKEQVSTSDIPENAKKALEILDELENFTVNLRKKLMAELRPGGNVVHLKLDDSK